MSWTPERSDPECLVFVDQAPRSGHENMELDRRALEHVCSASPNGGTVSSICRLYQWNTPTVTLGYFQDMSVPVPAAIQACPRVKRLTGGGAILHHAELTYSVALPAQHSIRHEPLALYEVIHRAIIGVLSNQGIDSSLRRDSELFGEQTKALSRSDEPFLCFLRQDDRDIVIGKHKVVGSAQRRRKGAILQHGSILLAASDLLPKVPGLADLTQNFQPSHFTDQLAAAIGIAIAPDVTVKKSGIASCELEQLLPDP